MDLDRYTIVLLLAADEAPKLSDEEASALQEAHMAHLADLHDAGHLLAAGPVMGAADRRLRGFSILNVDPDRALQLKSEDPAVKAGIYRLEAHLWMVPSGLMHFTKGLLPRSMAEVRDRATSQTASPTPPRVSRARAGRPPRSAG